jgi:hypothetical protein
MGLAPLAHTLDVVGAVEVAAPKWCAPPSALAGQFPGLAAGGFAAVVLVAGVAVIGEEKLAAAAAFTSLRSQTHFEPKPPRSQRKLKRNPRREEGPGRKKEEAIWREAVEENPGEENGISNRRFYPIFIPPLTSFNASSKCLHNSPGRWLKIRVPTDWRGVSGPRDSRLFHPGRRLLGLGHQFNPQPGPMDFSWVSLP